MAFVEAVGEGLSEKKMFLEPGEKGILAMWWQEFYQNCHPQ